MAAIYYAGFSGGFRIQDLPENLFKVNKWTYVQDKGLVDISNTNALGTEMYIGNLNSGSVKAVGFMTDELLDVINGNQLEIGSEVFFDLYLDAANTLGFTNVACVLDDITYNMDIQQVATFTITALISEPKP
jgi:hypothetical protein